jgi:hypothetical protein
MKAFNIIASCFLLAVGTGSCDLTGINNNPNKPTTDENYNFDDARLTTILRAAPTIEGADFEQRIKSLMIDIFSQMVIDGGGWDTRSYVLEDAWQSGYWDLNQKWIASINIALRNLEAKGDEYVNAIAWAKMYRVFIQSRATDMFGPLPFPSYKGEIVANPPYLSVEDQYKQFFEEIDSALALFDETSPNGIFINASTDVTYGGDITKWKKFANSLRLRFALRLSEVNADLCKTEAAKAIEGGVFANDADNAYMPPKNNGDWGQDYNYTMFQIGWGGPLNMSTSFEKLVNNIGGIPFPEGVVTTADTPEPLTSTPDNIDPRALKMFQPGDSPEWKGLESGPLLTDAGAGEYLATLYPELGFLEQGDQLYKGRPYDMFLYSEVCFLKAEAMARGFIAGDAKSEYENGVRASFKHWGVADQADTYLASTEKNLAGTSANYTDVGGAGNTVLEKIMTQKYLANFPDNSWEGWNDKRRLNLPRFDVPLYREEKNYTNSNRNILDPTNFIKRVQYPTKETTINLDEYNKGVALLGGTDVSSTKLWWDTNANYCTSDK